VLQVGVVRAQAKTAAVRLLESSGNADGARWFRELYERHSDDVRDTIALHGGPQVDAEDLVQEVFLAGSTTRRGAGFTWRRCASSGRSAGAPACFGPSAWAS
jgi:hypothetical protein